MQRPLDRYMGFVVLGAILAIFVVNALALRFYWYNSLWWFDIPMHMAGGAWIALLSFYFVLHSTWKTKKHTLANVHFIILLGFLSVIAIGVGWEIFEFSCDALFGTHMAIPIDSLSDIFMDLSGGALATFWYIYNFSSTPTT